MSEITLTSTKSEFEVNYVNSIIIKNDSKCALTKTSIWYSWHNISKQFDNNKLAYFNPDTQEWVTLELRDGMYDATTLNSCLIEYFAVETAKQCPFAFDVNSG